MRNTFLVVVVLVLATSCTSQWIQGNEDQQQRKLLQSSSNVDVYLQLGLTSSDCESQDEFGVPNFIKEWDEAMRCLRCSKIMNLQDCAPHPKITFRIRNRTTTAEQLQRLLNTLVVAPECVLQRFRTFGKIELNVTRDTSPELDIPSTSIRQNYNATRYPLLDYCFYESEPEGEPIPPGMEEDADTKLRIQVEFFQTDDIPGEKSAIGEEPFAIGGEEVSILTFPPPPSPPPLTPQASPPPYPPPSSPPLVQDEVATIPAPQVFPPTVDFNLQNGDLNCSLVNQAIDVANVSEIEENIGCVGCIQFDRCESGEGINGSIALNDTHSSDDTNIFIISFWRELICAVVDPQQNAVISFGYLPQPLQIPDWNSTNDRQCEGTIADQRKSVAIEPSKIPIDSPSYIFPEGTLPNDQTGDGNGEGDDNGDGGGVIPLWLIIMLVVISLLLVALLLIFLVVRIRRNNRDAGLVGYPINPSPIATPISSAGRQAALLARAEQFGYTPTFR